MSNAPMPGPWLTALQVTSSPRAVTRATPETTDGNPVIRPGGTIGWVPAGPPVAPGAGGYVRSATPTTTPSTLPPTSV